MQESHRYPRPARGSAPAEVPPSAAFPYPGTWPCPGPCWLCQGSSAQWVPWRLTLVSDVGAAPSPSLHNRNSLVEQRAIRPCWLTPPAPSCPVPAQPSVSLAGKQPSAQAVWAWGCGGWAGVIPSAPWNPPGRTGCHADVAPWPFLPRAGAERGPCALYDGQRQAGRACVRSGTLLYTQHSSQKPSGAQQWLLQEVL